MPNNCENCRRNCCTDFKITSEVSDPRGLMQTLSQFPFIKKTWVDVVLGPDGNEKAVGVYNCERLDKTTGSCLGYGVQERPSFCLTTGEKVAPHKDCLLSKNNG